MIETLVGGEPLLGVPLETTGYQVDELMVRLFAKLDHNVFETFFPLSQVIYFADSWHRSLLLFELLEQVLSR